MDMKRERKKERDADDGVEAETSFSFFLSLSSCPSLFSAFFLALTVGSINIFSFFFASPHWKKSFFHHWAPCADHASCYINDCVFDKRRASRAEKSPNQSSQRQVICIQSNHHSLHLSHSCNCVTQTKQTGLLLFDLESRERVHCNWKSELKNCLPHKECSQILDQDSQCQQYVYRFYFVWCIPWQINA